MSKIVLATLAAGGVVGGLLMAANARKAENLGAIVPVDDEINMKPYEIDKATAHKLHLDEDGKLRATKSRGAGAPLVQGQSITTKTTTVEKQVVSALDDEARSKQKLFEELLDPKQAQKLKSQYLSEHEKALRAQAEAQAIAAEASAAVAAAALLKQKEAEAKLRSEEEYRIAKELEEAAKVKKSQAWEDQNLAHQEHKHFSKADAEAQKKLAKQEELMREAARHEENARNLLAVAEKERAEALRKREEEARRRAEAADAMKRYEQEKLARETQAIEDAKRMADREKQLAAQKQIEANRALADIRMAEEKQEAARRALMTAQQALKDASDAKMLAEREAKTVNVHDVDSRLNAILRDMKVHEENAQRAREALAAAEREKVRAQALHTETVSISDKVKSWWRGDTASRPTVTAVAQSKGEASSYVDPSNKELAVNASGSAKVSLVETDRSVPGGRLNADITAAVGPTRNQSHSEIKMAESARDIGNPGAKRPTAY